MRARARGLWAASVFAPALVLLGPADSRAGEDAFQTWAGLDYERHLWMSSNPCREELLVETVPGLPRAGGCPTRADASDFSAALETRYRNLAGKTGTPLNFSHDESFSRLDLRLRPSPLFEFHSRLDFGGAFYAQSRDFENSTVGIGARPDENAWSIRSSLAFLPRLWFVPRLAVGVGSDGALETAVGLSGRLRGYYAAVVTGRKTLDLPGSLRLPGYAPFELPLRLRRDFVAGSIGNKTGRLELSATVRLHRDRHPAEFESLYSLSDSGHGAEYIGGVAWTDSGSRGRTRIAFEGETFYGDAVFRGTRARDGSLYQFAYEETRQQNSWVRLDAEQKKGRWEGGGFAGRGGALWNAVRPDIIAGHYFWDRNGVLDSYQGQILDIFSRETWLFDGSLGMSRTSAGLWAARRFGEWRARAGLTWHYLEMEAYGRLTKRTSTLILFTSQRDYDLNFYGIGAHLLTPELDVSRVFGAGRTRLEASFAQVLPLDVKLRGENSRDGGSGRPLSSTSGYSGGTEARLRVSRDFR